MRYAESYQSIPGPPEPPAGWDDAFDRNLERVVDAYIEECELEGLDRADAEQFAQKIMSNLWDKASEITSREFEQNREASRYDHLD